MLFRSARQLVEQMNGEIDYLSEPGLGSCFWVEFELGQHAAADATPPPLAGCAALLAMGDSRARDALVAQLEFLGCRTELACAYPAVDEMLASGAGFDWVVVDAAFDTQGGCRLLMDLRDRPARPLLAAIVGAGHDEAATMRAAGAELILPQPLSGTEIRRFLVKDVPAAAPDPAVHSLAAHVLVVEDHPVNREVAGAVLESIGCSVSVADDGRQAVEACRKGRFDLVLMDIQMPNMDGREATRVIRADEAARGLPRMPIIALTANALSEDREACLAAGMDDYLVKPVSGEQLWAVLSRWLCDVQPADPVRASPPPLPAPAANVGSPLEAALDVAVLLGLPGVNGQRESPMLQRLVALFVTETVRNVRSLKTLIAAGDTDAVKALAHKMKSGCFAIGALRLAALARALDERMKSGAEPNPAEAAGFADAWEGCRQALLDEGLISMEALSRVEGPIEQ